MGWTTDFSSAREDWSEGATLRMVGPEYFWRIAAELPRWWVGSTCLKPMKPYCHKSRFFALELLQQVTSVGSCGWQKIKSCQAGAHVRWEAGSTRNITIKICRGSTTRPRRGQTCSAARESMQAGFRHEAYIKRSRAKVVFSFQKITQYPSHQIFGHMHEALNTVKKITNYTRNVKRSRANHGLHLHHAVMSMTS